MPIVIPSYNGARKQANLTPLLAMLLHAGISGGGSRRQSRSHPGADRNHFTLLDIPATLHAGQAQAQLEAMNRCISRWGLLSAAGETAGDALADGRTQQRPYRQAGHAVWRRRHCVSSVSHPEYVPGWRTFRETGGRALLMHGTEGEVYANPQRCPQISLIDEQGVRVLYERQTEMAAEAVVLPTSKDPEVTARWIERCVAGVEPVPNSLKIQLACCLLACGKRPRWSRASAASTTVGDRICRIKPVRWLGRQGKGIKGLFRVNSVAYRWVQRLFIDNRSTAQFVVGGGSNAVAGRASGFGFSSQFCFQTI